MATEEHRKTFLTVIGEDRWRFEAAGWRFIGLNSMIMNTGLGSEAEQFDWLSAQLAKVDGKPVALFLHKPLYLTAPDDPEREAAIRYVPQPARRHLIEMFGAVDLRLVASGHVHQRRDSPLATPPCLVAVGRLHHFRCEAGSDRHQGNRAG